MSFVKHAQPKKRWLKVILTIFVILFLGISGCVFSIYSNAKKTVNVEMHHPVPSIDTSITKKKMKNNKQLTMLLLGIDTESSEKGRSDAIVVVSLDPTNDRMQLISIPRDTRTKIIGKGVDDKINHAYAFGGHDMAVATVENFLDIELDYFISVNMDGFKEIVDQLGSITVHNEVSWQDDKYEFNLGPLEMDGDQTMHFVRMRKKDPDGDFGRAKRQRQVIQSIIHKGATITSISKINGIVDILGSNMATNMDFDDVKKLITDYRDTRKHIVDYQIKGTGETIDGIYYLKVDDEEMKKVREMMISNETK